MADETKVATATTKPETTESARDEYVLVRGSHWVTDKNGAPVRAQPGDVLPDLTPEQVQSFGDRIEPRSVHDARTKFERETAEASRAASDKREAEEREARRGSGATSRQSGGQGAKK